jgi:hypothetical protein
MHCRQQTKRQARNSTDGSNGFSMFSEVFGWIGKSSPNDFQNQDSRCKAQCAASSSLRVAEGNHHPSWDSTHELVFSGMVDVIEPDAPRFPALALLICSIRTQLCSEFLSGTSSFQQICFPKSDPHQWISPDRAKLRLWYPDSSCPAPRRHLDLRNTTSPPAARGPRIRRMEAPSEASPPQS